MSTQVNEFELSIPFSAPVATVDSANVPTQDPSIAIGSPATSVPDPKTITVYANSITPTSFSGDDSSVAAFDVVFSVGIAGGDGTSKTYQIVKRIGIDKARVAAEVENTAPMSIVEAQPVVKTDSTKYVLSEVERMRRLAGL